MSEQYRPVSKGYLVRALRQAEAEMVQIQAEKEDWKRWLNNTEKTLARVNNNLGALLAERDGLARERDGLTREWDGLTRERDGLTRERDGLTRERDRLQDSNRALHFEVRGLMEKLDAVEP